MRGASELEFDLYAAFKCYVMSEWAQPNKLALADCLLSAFRAILYDAMCGEFHHSAHCQQYCRSQIMSLGNVSCELNGREISYALMSSRACCNNAGKSMQRVPSSRHQLFVASDMRLARFGFHCLRSRTGCAKTFTGYRVL